MPERSRPTSPLVFAAEGALHALIVVCPLCLGGAPWWVLWPLVCLSFLASGFVVSDALLGRRPLQLPVVALLPLVIAAACLLQLVRLPAPLLGALSPFGATLREFALVPMGLERMRPVSLDPASTWRELAKALSYASIVWATVAVCASRRARRRLLATIALTGGLLALVGLGHKLFEIDTLFGVHAFSFTPGLITTFANVNHLSGFLTLATIAGLGVGFAHRERPRQTLWVCVAVTCAGAVYLSGSRGGAVFLTAGVFLFFLAEWRRRSSEQSGRPIGVDATVRALSLIAIVGVGAYVGWETLAPRLETVTTIEKLQRTKIDLWPAMARAAVQFWPLGMGRGSYELAFTAFQPVDPTVVFSHPENVVLQLLSELGVPLAALVFSLAALVLWRLAGSSTRGALEAAVFSGLVAVGLHDCFDFALELPATAVAAAVMCATVFGSVDHREAGSGRVGLAALAGGLLAVLAAVSSRPDFRDAERELQALEASGALPSQIEARARTLVDRHPADYVLYVITSRSQSSRAGQPQLALAWVNRALLLRPIDSESHRFAARALLRLGRRSQAMLEYRLAGSFEEGTRLARAREELEVLCSTPELRLNVVRELMRLGRGSEAEAFARVDFAPAGAAVIELLVIASQLAVARHDFEAAKADLSRAARLLPDSAIVLAAQAQLLIAQGDREGAAVMLRGLTIKHPEDADHAFALAQLLLAMGRPREARDALARVSPFVVSQPLRAQKMMIEAGAFEAERSWAKAVASYQSAARVAPSWPQPHFSAAVLYERMGKFDEAEREIHAGARASGVPLSEDNKAWIGRLRQAAASRELRAVEPAPLEE